MFLLHPTIFIWDFLILLSLTAFLCIAFGSTLMLRRISRNTSAKIFVELLGGLSALCALVIVYGAFIEPRMLVVTERDVDLSIVDPLKIAVISDFHVGPYKGAEYVEQVVAETNRLLPDLILLVGDYIYTDDAELSDLLPLRNLRASAGVFAVLGNHDQGMYRTFFGSQYSNLDRGEEVSSYLESLGITMLRNEHRLVSLGTEDIVLAGIDDLWTGNGNVLIALEEVPTRTTILLSHNPSVIDEDGVQFADLIVSGHTHGGQIRIPGYGPIRNTPISIDQSYDHGVFPLSNNRSLAITRGTGETWARARLFAWPEVLLLNVN